MDSKQTIRVLPQLVPEATCFRCDVCCRFPEADSFLRPYFTGPEISDAVAHGVTESFFPDKSGSQVELVKNPSARGTSVQLLIRSQGGVAFTTFAPWIVGCIRWH